MGRKKGIGHWSMFGESKEKKRAKKEKKAEAERKQREWEDKHTKKLREKDDEKIRKVRKQREKEEKAKTSFERNQPKYEAWSDKDKKTQILMERYNLHGYNKPAEGAQKPVQQSPNLGRNSPNFNRPPSASASIASKLPPSRRQTSITYTPSYNSSLYDDDDEGFPLSRCQSVPLPKMNETVPKPTTFSTTTVQINYKNSVCYWPVPLVTEQNMRDRFSIKHPVLRLANAPKNIGTKLLPLADGRYSVQGGQIYVAYNNKDRTEKKQVKATIGKGKSYQEQIIDFLTLERFARGQVLEGGVGGAIVKEEVLQFSKDKRFVYKELKGYKDVESSKRAVVCLKGKWKLKIKGNFARVVLIYDKEKKDKNQKDRAQDVIQERKAQYAKWAIPGDGSIQC